MQILKSVPYERNVTFTVLLQNGSLYTGTATFPDYSVETQTIVINLGLTIGYVMWDGR